MMRRCDLQLRERRAEIDTIHGLVIISYAILLFVTNAQHF